MPSLFPEPDQPHVSATHMPANTWVNAHCDGGARGNPGPAGYGAVLVDGAGLVLAELSEFLGIRTNNFAEYSGLLGCLQWTLDHGHKRLRVVSDSELMVKQIQGKYKVNSPDLRPLWEEAKRRIAKLDGFEIAHALRHKNKAADRLANDAMDRGMKRPRTPGEPAPTSRATPYPASDSPPPVPANFVTTHELHGPNPSKTKTALHGRVQDGVIHLLDNATVPEGARVQVILE